MLLPPSQKKGLTSEWRHSGVNPVGLADQLANLGRLVVYTQSNLSRGGRIPCLMRQYTFPVPSMGTWAYHELPKCLVVSAPLSPKKISDFSSVFSFSFSPFFSRAYVCFLWYFGLSFPFPSASLPTMCLSVCPSCVCLSVHHVEELRASLTQMHGLFSFSTSPSSHCRQLPRLTACLPCSFLF